MWYTNTETHLLTNTKIKIMTRFNEVTAKLKKMYKGTEAQKDALVTGLKSWVRANRSTKDTGKLHAINSFLADLGCI